MEKSFIINKDIVKINNLNKTEDFVEFEFNGCHYQYHLKSKINGQMTLISDGNSIKALLSSKQILYKNDCVQIDVESTLKRSHKGQGNDIGAMISPMPGKIFKIISNIGDEVTKGETLLILEAMKMEHSVKASSSGIVKDIYFKEGELVDGGVVLASIEPKEELETVKC